MALDFPANPTNGQTYLGYTYSSTTGAWLSNSSSVAPVYMGDVPPTNPTSGNMWFNTTDGTLYLYYYDGNSYQWVEARAPITSDGYYSPNYIINGAFDIWQRGTSVAYGTVSGFGPDRWNIVRTGWAAGATISRQLSGVPNTQYCARLQRDSGNTSTAIVGISTSLESSMCVPLAGQQITVSFYARSGANFSASGAIYTSTISYGTGTDQNIQNGYTGQVNTSQNNVLTTSWQRFSQTVLLPSTTTEIALQQSFTPVGTAGAADYVEVTGVQLELGTTATPFRRNANSLQAELAACRRYYRNLIRQNGSSTWGVTHLMWSPYTTGAEWYYDASEMRAAPTLEVSAAGHFIEQRTGTVPTGVAISTANWPYSGIADITFTGLSSLVAGGAANLRANNTAAVLALSAEL